MATARYADILLPQVSSAFESTDNMLGQSCVGDRFLASENCGDYFIYGQKCVDPPAEVKPNNWVWLQIAKRLGLAEQYCASMANVPDNKWDEAVEELHREAYEKWAGREDIKPLNPPPWREFLKNPVFRQRLPETPHYAFQEDIESGQNPFRNTESGKIEFYSKGLAKGPDYLANNEFTPDSGKCYGPGNLPPMAQMTMGGKDTFYSKDAEKYPLLMSSPHSFYRVHSFLDNQPWLREDCYRHAVWINVSDAGARGINDNDMVKVYNDLGEMVLPAYVTSRTVPGTVNIFHGGWYVPGQEKSNLMPDGIDRRGAPNMLIHNEDNPMTVKGHFPCKGLVQVEKWRKP